MKDIARASAEELENLADVFAPSLKASLSKEIGIDAIVYAADEEETVIFKYPRIYQPGAALDVIRLEIDR